MARERGRHDPFVMRFVESLVNLGVVQGSVDPVDEEIGEEDEKGELQVVVQGKWLIRRIVVEFSVATNFSEEEWRGEDGHDGESDHGLADFEGDLVFEVFRVGKCGMVKDKDIRQRGADEVDDKSKEPVRARNYVEIKFGSN